MKNIVLCADGTWNTPHGDSAAVNDTNVRKLYCSLLNLPSQLKYYDSGVGTDGTPLDHLSGGAMGLGLFQKIQDCYAFLSNVYDPGDNIFLFGFSRGAYTARSVAGMISGFGVPTINLDNHTVSRIFDAYREPDPDNRQALKRQLTSAYDLVPVNIQMIGVWDTVGSLGLPGVLLSPLHQKLYGFLDTSLHPCVSHAYHAVSIDENRGPFLPTLWTRSDGSPRPNDAQLEQVWFSGVHCDVGGSYIDCELAEIPLSWMMHKARENGLQFSPESLRQYLDPPISILNENNITASIHNEWKIVPYGFPVTRSLPPGSTVANTVQLRLDAAPPTVAEHYRPSNLKLKPGTSDLDGYSIAQVLPYVKPDFPDIEPDPVCL